MLRLSPMKQGLKPKILDLDSGREVEIDDRQNQFFARIADRGYVMLDKHHDLVWIDKQGKPVKVLVDRN